MYRNAETGCHDWPEVFAIFSTFVVDGVWEWLNERLEMCVLQRSPDLNVSEALRRIKVETQRTGEQHWVLQQKPSRVISQSQQYDQRNMLRGSVRGSIRGSMWHNHHSSTAGWTVVTYAQYHTHHDVNVKLSKTKRRLTSHINYCYQYYPSFVQSHYNSHAIPKNVPWKTFSDRTESEDHGRYIIYAI